MSSAERRKKTPEGAVNYWLFSAAYWGEKNAAKNDAGIPVKDRNGNECAVDSEFDDMDEDGRREYLR